MRGSSDYHARGTLPSSAFADNPRTARKRTTTGQPALAPSTPRRTAPGRLDATPVGPDGAALSDAPAGETAPRGNPCPPKDAVPQDRHATTRKTQAV
jgi:hypothetical protein